jgi:hypothetical protein
MTPATWAEALRLNGFGLVAGVVSEFARFVRGEQPLPGFKGCPENVSFPLACLSEQIENVLRGGERRMGLKISGLNEFREHLERLRPEEVMARALAKQADRMADGCGKAYRSHRAPLGTTNPGCKAGRCATA